MLSNDYLAFGGFLAGWALLWRLPRLDPTEASIDGPLTIVIPARNEAARLPHLLDALLPGLPPHVRVVVVDDHSTDGTSEVVRRHPRLTLVGAPPLPDGWRGKTWACHVGAADAPSGDLVFLDADVLISSGALAKAVATRRARGGLLSVWPYHVVHRCYEQLSALFNVATLMLSGAGGLGPKPAGAALGPLMCTTTADYAKTGGHEAVRGEIVEDLAIGQAYLAAGVPTHLVGGGADVRFRMYGEGFVGMLHGWRKSTMGGLRLMSPTRLVLVVLWMFCSIGAFMWAGGPPRIPSIVLTVLFVVQMTVQFRRVGRFSLWNGLLYPVHVLFCGLVFLWSIWSVWRGGQVRWRGRELSSKFSPKRDNL